MLQVLLSLRLRLKIHTVKAYSAIKAFTEGTQLNKRYSECNQIDVIILKIYRYELIARYKNSPPNQRKAGN